MKTPIFILSMFVIGMVTNGCNSKKENFKQGKSVSQEELFLGQKPPGLIPELFAPGMVSTNHLEIEAAVSPNMKEFYFIRQKKGERTKSHLTQYKNGKWEDSEDGRHSSGEAFISTDNNRMYLGNTYKERTKDGWTAEKSVGEMFDKFPIMRLTASSSNTFFFDERDSIGTIRYAKLVDGKRETPKALGKQINSGIYTAHPFIAPDESYLIWDSEREGGYGGSDLYISFRLDDGSWGPAINMGKAINTEVDDIYGSITSNGKFFFFNSVFLGDSFEESNANIYWVDAKVIETLRPK